MCALTELVPASIEIGYVHYSIGTPNEQKF